MYIKATLVLFFRYIVLPNGILQIVDVQVSDAGVFRCEATNAAQTRYSQDVSLTVLQGNMAQTLLQGDQFK